MQSLFNDAAESIGLFNRCCLHYNLVADAIYHERRRSRAPFSPDYLPYVVAGLISFDIQRMMGKGIAQK